MKKTRILFRHKSLEMGGVQKVMLQLLKNLNKEKYDITLLLDLHQGELRNEIPKGIDLKYIGKGREALSKNKLILYPQLIVRRLKLEFFARFPKMIDSLILQKKYDIEVASTYTDNLKVLNSSNKNSKKLAWFHTDIRQKLRRSAQEVISELHQMDKVIFGSKQTRDIIISEKGVEYPNGQVIYNPIDYQEIKNKSEAFTVDFPEVPVFVAVARVTKRKGFDLLVEVTHRLIKEGFDFRVKIIGDGYEMDTIKQMIQERNLNDIVEMLGVKMNPYPYVKNADCYILSSLSESFPLIILESCSLGKPIIATNSGGVAEIITNEENGLLVEPTVEDIYKGMKRFLSDSDLRKRLDKGAQNMPKEFQLDFIINQVEEVFDNIIQN